jgi:glycosyltransferase involved in cell wall biosynthesis
MAALPHICILTTAHPKDDVRVDHKIGRSFLKAGFKVTWIGPDYSFSGVSLDDRYISRLYEPGRGRIGRFNNLIRAYRLSKKVPGVDVFYSPDPDAAFLAVRIANKHRAKVIFDIHELYHKAHIFNWAPRFMYPIVSRILISTLAKICTRCDIVLGVSNGVVVPYIKSTRQCMIIRNCAPLWFSHGPISDECGAKNKTFTIMHGKTTLYNGTIVVLRALALSAKKVPGIRAIMFECFDHTKSITQNRVLNEIKKLGITDIVDFRKPVKMDEMPSILRSCDIGMIAHGRQLEAGTQPNRLYEYMAVGLPILAPIYDKGIAPVIEAEKCGLLVDFEDPEKIADAIVRLYRHPALCREMGERARKAFLSRHNMEVEIDPLIRQIREWMTTDGQRDAE